MNQVPALIAGGLAGVLAVWYMNVHRKAPAPQDRSTGRRTFRQHWLVHVGAGLLTFAFASAVVVIATRPMESWTDLLSFLPKMLLFLVILPIFFESTMKVGMEGIECRPMLGRTRRLSWDDVESIRRHRWYGWFIVRAKSGESYRLSIMARGADEFLALCRGHLPAEAVAIM